MEVSLIKISRHISLNMVYDRREEGESRQTYRQYVVAHGAQTVGRDGYGCEWQSRAEKVHGRGPVEGVGGAFLHRLLNSFDGMGVVAAGGREGYATASGTAVRGVEGGLRGRMMRVS